VTTTLPAKTPETVQETASPRVPWAAPTRITPQLVAWAVALSVAYWLVTKVVVYDALGLNDEMAGVVFFPSAGLGIAAMMLTRPRIWPLWIAAIAVAEIAVNLQNGDALWLALGFALANTLEPVVGATLVRLDTTYRWRSRHGLQVRYFLGAVVLGPLVGGLIGGAFLHWGYDRPYVSASMKWWLGDALGVLVVATPILAWARRRVYTVPAGVAEDIAIAVAAVVVTVVPALIWNASTVYLVLPVLMWAALRGGPLGVSLAGCAFAFAANAMVARGNVDTLMTTHDPARVLIEVQFYIGITLMAGLVLAVEASERVRAERKLREAEAANARQELMTLQAVLQERRRIVRETHDIVGHALNAMILSAAAARRVLGTDPPAAQELLGTTEQIGRDAFRDLDVALGLVEPNAELAPARGVGDLHELVARLERAGVNVALHVDGQRRALPKLVDWSAYRIVQESLTNVTKHANGSQARVDVRYEPHRVVLTIADSGTSLNPVNGTGGRGLVGMQERVAMLGGRMNVGPVDEGGFVVHAELPTGYD
jgi:signal transduction histidine kinase